MAEHDASGRMRDNAAAGRLGRRAFILRAAGLGLSGSALAAFLSACGATATVTTVRPTAAAAATAVATNIAGGGGGIVATGAAAATSAAGGAGGVVATGAAAATNPAGAATAVASAVAGGGGAGDVWTIGANLDISGAGASLGEPERNTLQLLEKQVNDAGGIRGADGKTHRVRVIIYDNQSTEPQAIQVARKLLDDDKVPLIIGCTRTATTAAILNDVQKAEVPLISLAASASLVEPVADRKWIFKTPQSDSLMVGTIIEVFKKRGYKQVAFLSASDAFGSGGRDFWQKLAPGASIATVVDDRFNIDDKDLTTQINKVKNSAAEALVIWGITDATAVGTKNYADLGLKIPLYVSHGVANRNYIDLAGAAANGVFLPAGKLLVASELPDSDAQKAGLLKYKAEYEGAYGAGKVNTFGGHAWDAFQIAMMALAKVGPDRAKLRDEIEKVKEFVGITGVFNFSAQDHNGLDNRAVTLVTIRGGNWAAAPA